MKHQTPETITLEDIQEASRDLFIAARSMAVLAHSAEAGAKDPAQAVAIYYDILGNLGIAATPSKIKVVKELREALEAVTLHIDQMRQYYVGDVANDPASDAYQSIEKAFAVITKTKGTTP